MDKLVVKHNVLTNASYLLSLTEQRLILLAIVDARRSGKGITANDPLTITAGDYAQQFVTTRQASYLALKEASEVLFNRYFSYQEIKDGRTENSKSRWVSQISYVDDLAQVKLIFAPAVVPLITELERNFTHYAIEQMGGLSSIYSVRLYEVLMSWRGSQKTDLIELSELRNRMGIEDSKYQRVEAFKRRVLDLSVSQINKHTDIIAKYEQHKSGRKIIGFSFDFSFKKKSLPPKNQANPKHYTKADLDKNSELANPGESYEQALKRLNGRSKTPGTKEEQTKLNL
jgi:plasmid replication initiation protein